MINCYFCNLPKTSSYKHGWYNMVHNGIRKFNDKYLIVDNIQNAGLIFCIDVQARQIYNDSKQEFEENKKKFILICCRDTLLSDVDETIDKYVLCYLEHYVKVPLISNKFLCILNTSHMFTNNYIQNVKPLINRTRDVVFLGNIEYGGDIKLTTHRKQLCSKLKEICTKNKLNFIAESSIDRRKYYKVLRDTKIFVSPYGWGEWSLKEYECICYGCHVVKPNIYYKCFPNYYENMDHYDDDLEKLEQLLLNLLKNINDVQKKVDKNREMFTNYNDNDCTTELDRLIISKFS